MLGYLFFVEGILTEKTHEIDHVWNLEIHLSFLEGHSNSKQKLS